MAMLLQDMDSLWHITYVVVKYNHILIFIFLLSGDVFV